MTDDFSLPLTGAWPWYGAKHSHVGWVPNVSGHVSFGLICSKGVPHSINYRSEPTGQRTVVVHTRRSAEDFPLPGQFLGALRRSVTQDFVLVGRTADARTPFLRSGTVEEREEAHGALVGLILVVPRNRDPAARQLRNEFLARIDEAIDDALAEASSNSAMGPALADHLPGFIRQQALSAQAGLVCHIVHFALFRTGEIRIWFDDDLFLGRDTHASPATVPEQQAALHLPSQMYFFIKDTTHQHYHHDPETDQLLKLFPVDTSRAQPDDETWRIDTLRGLAKVVVECRHSAHPTSNKMALGILAYADAFQSLLARIRRGTDAAASMTPVGNIILYDFNHVRSSIEALDALNETQRGALLQFFGIIVGVVLSAFALWSGAVQIQTPLCDAMRDGPTPCPKMEPNTAVDVVNWVVANPLYFVVVLTILGFIAFEIFFKGLSSIPGVKRIRRWVTRFGSAVGAGVSRKLGGSDYIGFAVWLAIIASMSLGSAYVAWRLVPKHRVPTLGETVPRATGWSQLDAYVGKKPTESGLLTGSVIARDLRDLARDDYGDFLALMANAGPLERDRVLWVTGTGVGVSGRDAAYLIIDQANRKLEIGLRRNGSNVIHRSPGPVLSKPAAIGKVFDGLTGDMMPLAVEAAQCGTGPIGSGGATLIFSGALPTSEHCEYKVPLRAGQAIEYSPASARGLQFLVGPSGHQPVPIDRAYSAATDGTYIVQIRWEDTGGTSVGRALRPFYLRAHIR